MIDGKKVLAVVPARGGSKGVPLKNIRPVNGVPLIAYTGRVVNEVSEIDRAVVSTDHEDIARAAKGCGLAAPFQRPELLSGDHIGDWDVLAHALQEMEKQDRTRYDIVLMLQPTCPLRTAAHIREALKVLMEDSLDSVWSVSETDVKYHPLKQLVIDNGRMSCFDPRGVGIIARQQLGPVYHRNGAVYAMTRDCLLNQKKIMGEKAGAIIIRESLVNIDTPEDFAALEHRLALLGKEAADGARSRRY